MVLMINPLKDLEAFLSNQFEDIPVKIQVVPSSVMNGETSSITNDSDVGYLLAVSELLSLSEIIDLILHNMAHILDSEKNGVTLTDGQKEHGPVWATQFKYLKYKYHKYMNPDKDIIIDGLVIPRSKFDTNHP